MSTKNINPVPTSRLNRGFSRGSLPLFGYVSVCSPPKVCRKRSREWARKTSTPLIIILGYVERAKEASFEAGPPAALPGIPGTRITIWRVQGEGRVKWPPAVG